MRIATCLCAAAFAVASLNGTAAAATFHLSTGNGVDNGNGSFGFSSGGIGLTASAGLFDDAPNAVIAPGANNAAAVQLAGGLGVVSDNDTSTDIDGKGENDALILAFDQTVKLEGIWFSNVDLADDADFFFEQAGELVRFEPDLINVALSVDGFLDLTLLISLLPGIDPALLIGSRFGVGADAGGLLGLLDDDFLVKAVKVSEVPLPAAFPLFLASLAGLGFATRGKRAAPIAA